MANIHIFTTNSQEATKFKVYGMDHVVKFKPKARLICHNCLKKKWAQNLFVKSYYDGDYFFCKKECK